MKTIRPLLLPPGRSVIDDEIAAQKALTMLGVRELSPADAGHSGPASRHMLYEHHPTHWLLIGAHAGYPDPAKNGHEILCLPRDEVSGQGARDLFKTIVSMSTNNTPLQVGLITIVDQH